MFYGGESESFKNILNSPDFKQIFSGKKVSLKFELFKTLLNSPNSLLLFTVAL